MTIDMSQFFQVFFDEADELLAEMEKLLLAVDVSAPDPEDLNAIFRAAHSIKGGASTFGLSDMTEVTHVLESLLDKIRKGEMALTGEHVDAFLVAKDVLKMQLDGHRSEKPVDQDAVADVMMLLHSLSEDGVPASPKVLAAAPPVDHGDQKFESLYHVEIPGVKADDADALAAELGLLGHINRLPDVDGRVVFELSCNEGKDDIISICSFIVDPDTLTITEQQVALATAAPAASDDDLGYGFFEPLDNMFPALDNAQAAVPEPVVVAAPVVEEKKAAPKKEPEKAASQESSTIRVGIEKVDQLINLIGELVITQAMLEQRTQDLDPIGHERLLSSVAHLARNTRDLQEAVMSIRMMPMDYVFSRFPRMVRDLAGKLKKKVEFVTFGAATELDKGLIERIVDPLTHLVRNSIDHGIEMPAARAEAGKHETGRLSLSAMHQGGNIIIEVSDDGGGLNRDRILAKARQNGLSAPDSMSDPEVWQLIFAPGFSTAEVVTDVSGRGVGMDVVKRNITAMGGVVDIRSAKGYGTTITISLPLTLAILDGMSIRLGEEIYILPLSFVVESLQPAKHDIKDINGQSKVIKVRDEYLPLISLHQRFGVQAKHDELSEGILVIVEVDGRKAALSVDDLVGQQQVVVKNIESNYKKISGISGATILGDGGVALILDVSAILREVK